MSTVDPRDVLHALNEIRMARGAEPLLALPRGECGSAFRCPIARALAGVAEGGVANSNGEGYTAWKDDGETREVIPLPAIVGEFIEAFDAGEYPELVA